MQDGNHLIARIADSHMPTRIMESEVWRCLGFLRKDLFVLITTYLRADRHDEIRPRKDVYSCAQNLGL